MKEDFEGLPGRSCGEHRTVGWHRAWCFDCKEWCYPNEPCIRCSPASAPPGGNVEDQQNPTFTDEDLDLLALALAGLWARAPLMRSAISDLCRRTNLRVESDEPPE